MKISNKKSIINIKVKEKKEVKQIKDFIPPNLLDKVIPQQPLKQPSVNNIQSK